MLAALSCMLLLLTSQDTPSSVSRAIMLEDVLWVQCLKTLENPHMTDSEDQTFPWIDNIWENRHKQEGGRWEENHWALLSGFCGVKWLKNIDSGYTPHTLLLCATKCLYSLFYLLHGRTRQPPWSSWSLEPNMGIISYYIHSAVQAPCERDWHSWREVRLC